MLSEEQIKMIGNTRPDWWNKRTLATAFLCLLTTIFGGLTVWSINGMYTVTKYYVPGHPETAYEVLTAVDPTIQGLLAFFTLMLFFFSIALIVKRR